MTSVNLLSNRLLTSKVTEEASLRLHAGVRPKCFNFGRSTNCVMTKLVHSL